MAIPNVIHELIVKLTPRHTLFKLRSIHEGFDYFKGDIYYQGVLHYGVLILVLMIFLNLGLLLYMIYIRAVCLERPHYAAREFYRTYIWWSGFMILLLALVALFGVLMAYISWLSFTKKLGQAPLHNTACPIIQKLKPIPVKLPNYLLKAATAGPSAAAVAKAIGDEKIIQRVKTIDIHAARLFGNMDKATAPIGNITDKLEPLCDHTKKAEIKAPEAKVLPVSLLTGLGSSLITVSLGYILMNAIKFRSNILMTILIVILWLLLMVWGVVASAALMMFLTVADVCIDPLQAARAYLPTVHPNITDDHRGKYPTERQRLKISRRTSGSDVYAVMQISEFIKFYLECRTVTAHPLKPGFKALDKSLRILTEDSDQLVDIFSLHRALFVHGKFARDFRKTLDDGFNVTKSIKNANCSKSANEYQNLLVLPCHYVFWGLALLFMSAMSLTFFLTVYIMMCVRIRKFLKSLAPPMQSRKPRDVCPNTCPGPESDAETPLYFMPEVKVEESECPPSCKAFPTLRRHFTFGLGTKDEQKAERYACYPHCKKVYCDEFGNLLPPECIPVSEKSVETENMFMCTQTLARSKKGKQGEIKLHNQIIEGRMEKCNAKKRWRRKKQRKTIKPVDTEKNLMVAQHKFDKPADTNKKLQRKRQKTNKIVDIKTNQRTQQKTKKRSNKVNTQQSLSLSEPCDGCVDDSCINTKCPFTVPKSKVTNRRRRRR